MSDVRRAAWPGTTRVIWLPVAQEPTETSSYFLQNTRLKFKSWFAPGDALTVPAKILITYTTQKRNWQDTDRQTARPRQANFDICSSALCRPNLWTANAGIYCAYKTQSARPLRNKDNTVTKNHHKNVSVSSINWPPFFATQLQMWFNSCASVAVACVRYLSICSTFSVPTSRSAVSLNVQCCPSVGAPFRESRWSVSARMQQRIPSCREGFFVSRRTLFASVSIASVTTSVPCVIFAVLLAEVWNFVTYQIRNDAVQNYLADWLHCEQPHPARQGEAACLPLRNLVESAARQERQT